MEIAIHAKLKNGTLWQLVQQYGSVKALADEVGIFSYHWWVNAVGLRCHPWGGGKCRTRQRKKLAEKLFALTGKTLQEIFPTEKIKKTRYDFYRDVDIDLIAGNEQKFLPSPEDLMIETHDAEEVDAKLQRTLRRIPTRDAAILMMHSQGTSFADIAKHFDLSRSRVHQAYYKALERARHKMEGDEWWTKFEKRNKQLFA